MTHSPLPSRHSVLGLPVDTVTGSQAAQIIFDWAARHESRTVCLCNTDSLVRGMRDERHARSLTSADLVLPDGAPVAWAAGEVEGHKQPRVPGPDLMWDCCARAADLRVPVFLYGGTPTTLDRLQQRLRASLPKIEIAGAISPPFRQLSPEEDTSIVDQINRSGAGLVWVGLGCPKQEAWLAAHRGPVHAVMLGVGAAFDFHAGTVKRAPEWMQHHGLEWLYRLGQDPRRLARRYLVGNSLFMIAVATRYASGRRLGQG
jgi:N-acetylglucosaminyldiphosphoundecaprenol N-acetyl-beta-D-mannosaminyltransferase